MRKINGIIILILTLLNASIALGEKKPNIPGFAWANGILYGTEHGITYSPNNGARNTLLVFQGLKGQRAVAEAAPGDINYQNGRWQVVILEFTPEGRKVFDINNDGYSEFEITNWDMAQHFMNDHSYLKVIAEGAKFDAPLIRPKGLEPPEKKSGKGSENNH